MTFGLPSENLNQRRANRRLILLCVIAAVGVVVMIFVLGGTAL